MVRSHRFNFHHIASVSSHLLNSKNESDTHYHIINQWLIMLINNANSVFFNYLLVFLFPSRSSFESTNAIGIILFLVSFFPPIFRGEIGKREEHWFDLENNKQNDTCSQWTRQYYSLIGELMIHRSAYKVN